MNLKIFVFFVVVNSLLKKRKLVLEDNEEDKVLKKI